MTLEAFKSEIKKLNEKFSNVFTGAEYFIDGALSEEEYYYCKPYRILWLMKEAYGDPFSYPKYFTQEYDKFFNDLVIGKPRATWGPVVYITYSILNNFQTWEQMEYIKDQPEMVKILSKIAWVNIQKLPSLTGSSTDNKNIDVSIVKYGDLLKEQIDLLNPNIVICGNTFRYIEKEYGFPMEHKFQSVEEYVPHYVINDRLFIDPYHPSYAGRGAIDLGMYVNDIRRTIKEYFQTRTE